jgi:hypothetical protein
MHGAELVVELWRDHPGRDIDLTEESNDRQCLTGVRVLPANDDGERGAHQQKNMLVSPYWSPMTL